MIPREEHKVNMYPMDFEEFLWAIQDNVTADTIKMLLSKRKSAGNAMHRNLMRIFRFASLFANMDSKWLRAYERATLYGEIVEIMDYSPEIDKI